MYTKPELASIYEEQQKSFKICYFFFSNHTELHTKIYQVN